MRRLVRVATRTALGYLLAVLLLNGCAGEPPPRIPDYDGWFASALPEWRAGEPYSMVGVVNLCIDRQGSIEIIDVTFEHSEGGMRVDAFATRPLLPPAGETYPEPVTFTETLWERGFVPGETTVDTVCPDWSDESGDYDVPTPAEDGSMIGTTGFGVQFSKPTDQTARGAILQVTYRSNGKTFVRRIGLELILCEENHGEEDVPECEFRDLEYYDW
jgi:hypothetical protein